MANENETASAPAAQAAPPKKKSFFKRLIKGLVVLFILLIIVLAALPAVASATFLTGVVRGQLVKQFGAGADVAKVSFGWTSGLSLEGLKLPPGPKARDKSRAPVTLEKVDAKFSTISAALAALHGGSIDADVEVASLKVYFEQGKDGTNLLGIGEPAAGAKPGEPAPAAESKGGDLPCGANAKVKVDAIDVEFWNYASEPPQRITIDKLRVGLLAKVAKDKGLVVDKVELPAAVTFDAIRVEKRPEGKAPELVVAIEKPAIQLTADVAGAPPANPDAPPGLEGALQVNAAKPGIAVAKVYGTDFDLRDLKTEVTVEKKTVALAVNAILKGLHEGKLGLNVKANIKSKHEVPVELTFSLDDVDISGMVAKQIPRLLPILDGAATDKGAEHLPRLTLHTGGTLAALYKPAGLDKDATTKTIATNGELKLGPGKFDGSKILAGYLSAVDELGLRPVVDQALGGALAFDGTTEKFNIKDGVITIPAIELVSKSFGLSLSGTVTFDQKYSFGIHLHDSIYPKLAPDVAKLFKSLDAAGGIKVEGEVGGEVKVVTPSAEELAKAAIAGGAIDLWRARGGKTAQKLDAALSKTGVSLEKIAADPKQAAEDAAKKKAEEEAKKAAEGKLGKKIQDKTGIDPSKLLPGSGDDKDKKDDKKDGGFKIPNPFGG